jgi:hypothetical protein
MIDLWEKRDDGLCPVFSPDIGLIAWALLIWADKAGSLGGKCEQTRHCRCKDERLGAFGKYVRATRAFSGISKSSAESAAKDISGKKQTRWTCYERYMW